MDRTEIRFTVYQQEFRGPYLTVRESLAQASIVDMVEEITLRTGVNAYPILDLLTEEGKEKEFKQRSDRHREMDITLGSWWYRRGVRYHVTKMLQHKETASCAAVLTPIDSLDETGAAVRRTRVQLRNVLHSFHSLGDGEVFEWKRSTGKSMWRTAELRDERTVVATELYGAGPVEMPIGEFFRGPRVQTRPIHDPQ